MKIAFVLYEQFTALDLAGPYEVIARWPGAEVHFVATGPDLVRADAGLVVLPTGTLDSLTAPERPAATAARGVVRAGRGQGLVDLPGQRTLGEAVEVPAGDAGEEL
jgi:putative intracellular protease/amidase